MPDIHQVLDGLRELAPLGAVIVFAIALVQYSRAESWKRTEFVANLYKQFFDNEDCKRALWMLQGDKRKLCYTEVDKLVPYGFNYDELKKALDDAATDKELSPAQLHIRDTLDTFFVYLEQFERAIQRRLVSQEDVYPYFGYWIALLSGDPDASPPEEVLTSITNYIDIAGFDDVQKFLNRT